ncbi:porin [Citrobacter meridianamericanus]|uniref:porin n=1 Tax=Citrobacter meridianamericanus TaxID=2894201 RepID=UPI00351DA8EB
MRKEFIYSGCLLVVFNVNATEIFYKDKAKLELYGKVDGLRYFSDEKSEGGDMSYFRMGFRGETKINDKMTGYGRWEYNILTNQTEDTGDNAWTRLAYAGLKHHLWGSVDYGRNYGILYDVEGYTDMLPEFGGNSYTQSDVFMTGRTHGVLTYRNKDLFGLVEGLNIGLQYQGKNDNSSDCGDCSAPALARQNGEGYGGSLSYDSEMGISIAASLAVSDRTKEQKEEHNHNVQFSSGDKSRAWSTGMKYDANRVYMAAMYAETRNMTTYGIVDSNDRGGVAGETRNIEVTLQYQFDSGVRPALSYIASHAKKTHSPYGDEKYLVRYVDVSTTYHWNKNISTYVDYQINLLDTNDSFYSENGIATDNIVAVGLVYQF